MANDPRAQLQQVIDGRNQKSTATAATANIVNFQDWLFYGTAPDIFVNVGVVPIGNVQITYAVVVFQTPGGFMLGNATVGTDNAGNWAMNLALSIDNYSIQQYGNQVEAWAFAQISTGQGQYSSVQSYTVS